MRPRRRSPGARGKRREHRVEERQRQRGPQPAEDRASWQRLSGQERHLVVSSHQERRTLHDARNQGGPAIVAGCSFTNDRAHGRAIVVLEAAAKRIRHQLLGHRPRKLLWLGEEERPQPGEPFEFGAAQRRGGVVDRPARFVNSSPRTDGIELFEREAKRIDHRVTTRTAWIRPVLCQPLPNRRRRDVRLHFREVRVDAGRRRGRGQPENVVQQEFAAQHRRGAIGIGRRRQQRPVREEATSLIGIGERHAPEATAVDSRNSVVPRQPFVDERVVGVEQLDDAAIFPECARDEELGLALEGLQQALVVGRIPIGIDDDLAHPAQVQPLRRESVNERAVGTRIRQHPAHFALENRRARELVALGQVEQALIGDAAPQEERQARGDFKIAQAIDRVLASTESRYTRSRKSGSTSTRSSAS